MTNLPKKIRLVFQGSILLDSIEDAELQAEYLEDYVSSRAKQTTFNANAIIQLTECCEKKTRKGKL